METSGEINADAERLAVAGESLGANLAGLPPATVIDAEIDPLHSEGEVLATNLEAARVAVQQMTYTSITHEFFGMGAVVPAAKEAVAMAAGALREAFAAR